MDKVEHLVVESKKGQTLKHWASPVTVIVVIKRGTCQKPVEFHLTSYGVRNASLKITILEQNGAKEEIEEERTLATDKVPMKASEDKIVPEKEADTEMPQMIVTVPVEHNPHHQGQDDTGCPHRATDTVTYASENS